METLSQSQKDALIKVLDDNKDNPDRDESNQVYVSDWDKALKRAIWIIESFPTTPEGPYHDFETLNVKEDVISSEPSENRWIPVTEKLPVARELVLFTNSEDNWVLVGFVFYGKWYNYEDFPNPIKNGCECYPTHWQPLPPPPTN